MSRIKIVFGSVLLINSYNVVMMYVGAIESLLNNLNQRVYPISAYENSNFATIRYFLFSHSFKRPSSRAIWIRLSKNA